MATRKKAAKQTTRKAAKATRRSAARKRPAASLAPKPVKTGKGPAPLEVANTVLSLLRAGSFPEVHEKWLAPGIVSVEGVGASIAFTGKKAVLAKYGGWEADHEVHDSKVEGPWVGATGFCLKFKLDATQKSTGQRSQMEEIAVYTVQNGKIVREEFHFATGG
jgi:hypothetical protein